MNQDRKEPIMESEARQQIELLESVVEYAPKAIGELKKLVLEFYGIKQEDSDEYLEFVLENSNWMIEALNATVDFINEESQRIDKVQANQTIIELNAALSERIDAKIAEVLDRGLIPLLEAFMAEAQRLTKNSLSGQAD